MNKFGGSIGVGSAQCATETAQKSIPNKLEYLDQVISNLGEELGYLASNLEPVLAPIPPQASKGGELKSITGANCSVANKLQTAIERVQALCVAASDLRSRVEV